MPAVVHRAEAIPSWPADAAPAPPPTGVLLADPAHFDVVEVQNPHMAAHVGGVDRAAARAQWDGLAAAFRGLGLAVHVLPPVPGLPDLVFTANPSLPVPTADGRVCAVLSRMRHASRRPEVAHHERFWRARGAEVRTLEGASPVEGCGDVVHVPGRGLLLGGHGFRTDAAVYPALARAVGLPIALLPLCDPAFYHLDTCVMPLDAQTVLTVPGTLAPEGEALLRTCFRTVLDADPDEARIRLACNVAVVARAAGPPVVVMDARCPRTAARLEAHGYRIVPVETGEFLKSGGGVYCLKNWVW